MSNGEYVPDGSGRGERFPVSEQQNAAGIYPAGGRGVSFVGMAALPVVPRPRKRTYPHRESMAAGLPVGGVGSPSETDNDLEIRPARAARNPARWLVRRQP